MGYFDALTSSAFKTAPDGRRLFFPWGALGRGYVIGSDLDYERLRSQIKTYLTIAMPLVFCAPAFALNLYLAALVVAGLCVFHFARMRSLLRGLQPSDERLSLREILTAQAPEHSPVMLWLLATSMIAIVACCFFIIAYRPGNLPIAITGIVLCGLCAVPIIFMLVLQRRGSP